MTADFSLGRPECFMAVANTGSMSAAAVRCHPSQTGISTAITDLERRLGVQLLVRRRAKGVHETGAEAGLACTTVRSSKPYAILSPGHTLAGRAAVSLTELADEPLIVQPERRRP
ncbi:LysR family transcriptional regulator [Streptomyces sp. CA-210063]|uniref:LysR family transcriptional regulator n=1 Tax=Streptomyces sp. CA-210063 TaxID=2801029 RepID=UPI00214C761D|nr:LysR family transcriptional regulator [Streptomyces sp. CA-210063]UUU36254.1 LysR family transcriptional regulator [Streptomyces sp. CA-210063]